MCTPHTDTDTDTDRPAASPFVSRSLTVQLASKLSTHSCTHIYTYTPTHVIDVHTTQNTQTKSARNCIPSIHPSAGRLAGSLVGPELGAAVTLQRLAVRGLSLLSQHRTQLLVARPIQHLAFARAVELPAALGATLLGRFAALRACWVGLLYRVHVVTQHTHQTSGLLGSVSLQEHVGKLPLCNFLPPPSVLGQQPLTNGSHQFDNEW
mmetsp:Transcript_29411/g.85106  ORF Transcript_29411/g.85106 Transcript_29411/m.85106 type:complete len:208 (+) Transcript_29411:73-696(+)